jgi:hypothetical protein
MNLGAFHAHNVVTLNLTFTCFHPHPLLRRRPSDPFANMILRCPKMLDCLGSIHLAFGTAILRYTPPPSTSSPCPAWFCKSPRPLRFQ